MTDTILRISPNRGRGIFTTRKFDKDETVLTNYTIFISKEDVDVICKTSLWNYYFEFPDGSARIVLGQGTIINHSLNPNVKKVWHFEQDYGDIVNFVALRTIEEGEELFHDYCFDSGTEPNWIDN